MTTDTSERGLERLICTALTGSPCDTALAQGGLKGEATPSGGAGWICGAPEDYDCEYTVDLVQILVFLVDTQPDAFEGLRFEDDGPARRKFLARLQGEVSKRGIIDVLLKGVKDGPYHVELFYGTPSPGNPAAAERYAALLHGPEQIADLPVPVAESPGAVRIGHPERSHLVEYLAPNSVFNSLPRQRSSPHLRPDDRLVTIDRVLHHASLGVA